MPSDSRNPLLTKRAGGIERKSRTASYKAKNLWKDGKKKAGVKQAAAVAASKEKDFCGGKRTIATGTKFYPTEDVPKAIGNHKHAGTATLRASITPGTVLILLAGPFRGKRVVFLKQLDSGLLLVTGPYSFNGVPLKRVDQTYVIATSTKTDISGATIPADVNDAMFTRPASAKKSGFFAEGEEPKKEVSAARQAAQKAVDAGVESAVSAVPQLKEYLRTLFTLRSGQYPHEMKF